MNQLSYSSCQYLLFKYSATKKSQDEFDEGLLLSFKSAQERRIFNESSSRLSEYRNHSRNIPKYFLEGFSEPESSENISDFFKAEILPFILSERQFDLLEEFTFLIENDWSIAKKQQTLFLEDIRNNGVSSLAGIFHYAMQKGNAKYTPHTRVNTLHNLPYIENDYFEGRDRLLGTLVKSFEVKEKVIAITQSISGMGGIGKTQIALEYAYRNIQKYKLIWWLNAESANSLMKDIRKFVKFKQLGRLDSDDEHIQLLFLNFFDETSDWLLIVDNVTDYKVVLPLFPKLNQGDILTTTQLSNVRGIKISVDVFTDKEAFNFLKKRIPKNRHSSQEDMANLASLLGNFPLALEQAGAYISEIASMNVNSYIALYQSLGVDLLYNEAIDYEKIVLTTWQIAINKMKSNSSRQLLLLASYLASDELPIDFFIRYANFLPDPLSNEIKNEFIRGKILQEITRYSIVKEHHGKLSIHRLVQAIMRKEDEQRTHLSLLVTCLIAYLEDTENSSEKGLLFESMRGHIDQFFEHVSQIEVAKPVLPRDTMIQIRKLYIRKLIGFGEYRQAIKTCQSLLEEELPTLLRADIQRNLALSYKLLGEYDEALAHNDLSRLLYKEADNLEGVAACYNNIANIYKAIDNVEEAIRYCEKSLSIKEKLFKDNPNHRDILTTRSNLANLFSLQGKKEKALAEHRHIANIREKEFGATDTHTCQSYGNIGLLYRDDFKDYKKAIVYFNKTLSGQRTGIDQRILAETYKNLALCYKGKRDFEESKRYLEISERLLDEKLTLDSNHELYQEIRKIQEELRSYE